MSQFESHHLFSCEEAKQYAMTHVDHFHNAIDLTCEEIGDGNINYIFRVINHSTHTSIIIKQADQYLRSSGSSLTLDRSRMEAQALQIQYAFAPSYIPQVYSYDPIMRAVIMEDISSCHNLRKELIKGNIYPDLPFHIAHVLVSCLMKTSDLCLNAKQKKRWQKQFVNPELCQISEDLVFMEPYNDARGRNQIPEGLMPFVIQHIYKNDALIAEAGRLRYRFMNLSQSLLHGDLHTGSIFINQSEMKIIDPEFAFYGPMGYDIGNVIAHMLFPLVYHWLNSTATTVFMEWLKQCIMDIYDQMKQEFYVVYDAEVTLDMYQNPDFKASFIDEVMADAISYAGTELIRRSIGDTKVEELTLLDDIEQIQAIRLLLEIGCYFILHRNAIHCGRELLEAVMRIMEADDHA